MTTIKAVLLKPLDGQPEGAEREFEKLDFERLEAMAAVRKLDDTKAAPAPLNKAHPAIENKAAPGNSADVGRSAKPKA